MGGITSGVTSVSGVLAVGLSIALLFVLLNKSQPSLQHVRCHCESGTLTAREIVESAQHSRAPPQVAVDAPAESSGSTPVGAADVDETIYRAPREAPNRTQFLDDPNRKDLPCADFSNRRHPPNVDAAALFRDVPRSEFLEVSTDWGSPCFTAWSVRDVVLGVTRDPFWFGAVHVPTRRAVDVSQPIFCDMRWLIWGDNTRVARRILDAVRARLESSSLAAANASDPAGHQSNMGWDAYVPFSADVAPLSAVTPKAAWDADLVEFYYRVLQPAAATTGAHRGNGAAPQIPIPLPPPPRVHVLLQYFVGSYPAICFSIFIAQWAHYYGSGLQRRGIPVLLVGTSDLAYTRVVHPFLRYLPSPKYAVGFDRDLTMLHASEMTFAPFGWIDAVEPCTTLFLQEFLVPTVVREIRSALKQPRNSVGGPWWPRDWDNLLRNPPEKIMVLKSKHGQTTVNRIHDLDDPHFLTLASKEGFTILPDTLQGDLRMYFFNHAKVIVVSWGGALSVIGHMLAGNGVFAQNVSSGRRAGLAGSQQHGGPADLIILYHPNYHDERFGMYLHVLGRRGVDYRRRTLTEDGLEVHVSPPGSAPFGVPNVFTKLVNLPDVKDLRASHLRFSAEQREKALDPSRGVCRELFPDEIISPGPPTGYEVPLT